MTQLVIRGHATRGKEVIEILEMLGGENKAQLKGTDAHMAYYICSEGYIDTTLFTASDKRYKGFTLEEFLEKYPYKVGDKVQYKGATSCGSVFEIEKMRLVGNNVEYIIKRLWYLNDHTTATVEDLQPYEETPIEAPMYLNEKANKQAEEIEKILEPVKEIMKEMKLDIPEGYEFFCIDDDNKIVLTKKQSQYPKTYKECCKVLDIQSDWHLTFELNNPTSCDLCVKNEFEYICKLEAFRKLLICRDAYWKIVGEQMGLGKPWEPDWRNIEQDKFVLYTHDDVIWLNRFVLGHNVLAFPTVEMRDAFYENFKELIELCKELL